MAYTLTGCCLKKILNERIFKNGNIAYINVSVVAHTPKLYTKVCNASGKQFFSIERNILDAIELKNYTCSSIEIGVKILLCRENFFFAFEIFNYFKSIGVDNILIRCVGNFEPGQDVELLPEQINYLKNIFRNNLGMSDDQITADKKEKFNSRAKNSAAVSFNEAFEIMNWFQPA